MTYKFEPYRVGKLIAGEKAFTLIFDPVSATFGKAAPYRCVNCGPIYREPKYHMTHRQTLESPEEGEVYCEECGSEECGDNEEGCIITVTKRYSIHRNPNYRKSA